MKAMTRQPERTRRSARETTRSTRHPRDRLTAAKGTKTGKGKERRTDEILSNTDLHTARIVTEAEREAGAEAEAGINADTGSGRVPRQRASSSERKRNPPRTRHNLLAQRTAGAEIPNETRTTLLANIGTEMTIAESESVRDAIVLRVPAKTATAGHRDGAGVLTTRKRKTRNFRRRPNRIVTATATGIGTILETEPPLRTKTNLPYPILSRHPPPRLRSHPTSRQGPRNSSSSPRRLRRTLPTETETETEIETGKNHSSNNHHRKKTRTPSSAKRATANVC